MKVLHIDTGRQLRGGQHQVLLLLQGLRAEGHECQLLARRGSPLAHAAIAQGFPVHPAELRELWQRSRTVDLVHAHDARAHSIAAVAAQKRFVVARRVSFPVGQTFVSKLKYGRAARYLAVSQFVAAMLQQAGVPRERVDVIFDAVPPFAGAGRDGQDPLVIAPAFRNDSKKLTEMTEAACRLAGAELLLSHDLTADLPKGAVFVYLTRSEGLGSAALLAMAAGVPVIASRVEGLAEVFEHDSSGLYVNNQPEEVASSIRRVLDHPDLALRLREAAHTRVAEAFSVARMVRETILSYEQAVAG